MLLERRDEIRHELDRHDDAGSDRSLDDVLRFRFAEVLVGERHHLTERQREIEGGVGDRAEVRVDARLAGRFVGDDREVDLLPFGWLIAHGDSRKYKLESAK